MPLPSGGELCYTFPMSCTFAPLCGENVLTLQPFFEKSPYGICDYTVGAVYQWRHVYDSYFTAIGGFLCIRAFYDEYGMCYTMPIGDGDWNAPFERIECDARENGLPLRFAVIPGECLPLFEDRYGDRMRAESIRDWADYVYDAEAFRTYAGKALHTQKNHVNRFWREHPDAQCVLIDSEERYAAVCAFLRQYAEQHPDSSLLEQNELRGAWDLLMERDRLGQTAACLVENERVLAISIGEAQGDMLFVHVEKALLDVPGAYPAMAQSFVKLFPDVKTVNREDDGGDAGLRYSKLQYKPKALIEKYLVTIE